MRIDDELIDGTLRSAPAWQPPAGFVDRVAASGVAALRADAPVPRLWSWMNISAVVPLAIMTALVLYAAAALTIAAWFALRAYAAD